MKVTSTIVILAGFFGSGLAISVKDSGTPSGPSGSPNCIRQCLITLGTDDGASSQRSEGFAGSCKEYADRALSGANRAVDGGRLNINGVGGNLVIDFVKNGRDRRASFTNCKNAVYTGGQCVPSQGGCDFQGQSG
ncbi:hypothetical protein B0J13DRAFT_672903 [Dactylonectria estremocensis]|uniref:Uncharacterized protein n=1 Tax=Dactylonectria estremocensis TaxID=1079267 RepID=A0A9P9F2R0_9HYPO|nr:hypothetical protein B0J13DRAFT_672903 [Dactylonectria estremocensis]